MCHLERALEWLRPLILGSNTWDYCVLWKLGDDPSRFIEWVDCCCNGGGNQQIGSKRIKREQNVSFPLCKDVSSMHPANTKACVALANLPSSLSLYSGIHGEVVISNCPKWLNIANTSDSQTSNEDSIKTQVLIPVVGGLVELFSAKLIPEDQRVIELVKTQFNISSEIETISSSTISFDGHSIAPFLDKSTHSSISSLNQPEVIPWRQPITQIAHHYNHPPNFDVSSTGSFASDEHTSPDSNPCSVSQGIPLNLCNSRQDDHVAKERRDSSRKPESKNGKSKNLFTERKRRNKIKDGLFTLRSLVPNITKMDRAAILGDAIDYIESLKNQINELEDELKDLAKEDCDKTVSKLNNSGKVRERPKLEVHVKVNKLGTGHFLLRIRCQQRPGAFTKLLEALGSLGLDMNDVKDANVTTCNDMTWVILTVQTNKKEIEEKDLRESLTRVAASS